MVTRNLCWDSKWKIHAGIQISQLYHTLSVFFVLVAWCRWNIRTRPSESLISWSSYPSFQQETVRNADLVRELLGHWKVTILSRQLFQPSIFQGWNCSYRIGSMYDIFIIFMVNAGKYTIHGSSGYVFLLFSLTRKFWSLSIEAYWSPSLQMFRKNRGNTGHVTVRQSAVAAWKIPPFVFTISSWWFQPILKIWVKFDHFPK